MKQKNISATEKKSHRLRCLNPKCRRTSDPAKYPGCDSIVCYQCWKTIPKAYKDRYKLLRKRERLLIRAWKKKGVESPEFPLINEHMQKNWANIVLFFRAPEKPEGMDTFLEEVFGEF